MKSIILSFIFGGLLLFTASNVSAQKIQKQSIKVYGNCDMCKERIESALDVKGIKLAKWDQETLMLEVVYRKDKISEAGIHQLLMAAGHDTQKGKASEEAYNGLHACCKYRENPKCTQ